MKARYFVQDNYEGVPLYKVEDGTTYLYWDKNARTPYTWQECSWDLDTVFLKYVREVFEEEVFERLL